MSQIKDYMLSCQEWQEAVDLNAYDLSCSLASLSNQAWPTDDQAVWAPTKEWIAETKQQLADMMQCVLELESAQEQLEGGLE